MGVNCCIFYPPAPPLRRGEVIDFNPFFTSSCEVGKIACDSFFVSTCKVKERDFETETKSDEEIPPFSTPCEEEGLASPLVSSPFIPPLRREGSGG